jgi:hypothetical protein
MVSFNVSPQRLIQACFLFCRAVSIGYSCTLVNLFPKVDRPRKNDAVRQNDVSSIEGATPLRWNRLVAPNCCAAAVKEAQLTFIRPKAGCD